MQFHSLRLALTFLKQNRSLNNLVAYLNISVTKHTHTLKHTRSDGMQANEQQVNVFNGSYNPEFC